MAIIDEQTKQLSLFFIFHLISREKRTAEKICDGKRASLTESLLLGKLEIFFYGSHRAEQPEII